MSVCVDVDQFILDAVDESAREVFSTMIGEPLTRSSAAPAPVKQDVDPAVGEAVTVLLGLTGGIQGSLSISLTRSGALHWTRALIDHDTDVIDQIVVDAVGELGNMVIGGAKRRMAEFNLTMSLPSVMLASDASLVFPTNTVPLRLLYQFANHPLTFVIALRHG